MASKILATPVALASGAASDIVSFRDLGYKQAKHSETSAYQAAWAIEHSPGFPETELNADNKTQLYDGYRLRFGENNPGTTYAIINGNYVTATDDHMANKSVEKILIDVGYAFGLASHEFGKLKNENHALHAVVKIVRDKAGTYCSNRLGDLIREAKRIKNAGKERARAATVDFSERVAKALDDLGDKCKLASLRGDETADAARYKAARIAFLVVWSK